MEVRSREYGVSTPALLEMDLCLALGLAERPGLVLQGLIGQPHGALDTQLHHTTFAQIRAHWRFPPHSRLFPFTAGLP